MDSEEIFECEAHVGYIYCRKYNGVIRKNTTIMKLGESFNKLLYSFLFNNQHIPIPNVFMICDLAFFSYSCGERIFFSKMVH